MNRPQLKQLLLSSTLLGLAGLSIVAVAPASAQEAAPQTSGDDDVVVVTGTRISREGYVSSSPIQTINTEELAVKQPTDVEDVLRAMPQFLPGNGDQVNNGSAGVSSVDLRGLTTPRTLPLIDGKRMVPYDPNGVFDVTAVPLALLERVDVVTGGASSVYGSDAIAGVGNFILNDDFQGAQFDAAYSITDHGDGETENYAATVGAGFDDGRGNVVLSLGYLNKEPIYQVRGPASLTPGASSYATPASFDFASGRRQIADTGALVVPYAPFNFNPQNLYQTPQTRWTVTALAKYEINDYVEAYGRYLSSSSTSSPALASSAVFGDTLEVQLSNPFITPASQAYFAANGTAPAACSDPAAGQCTRVGVRWRAADVGPRQYVFDYDTFQVMGGLRGEIWGWDWDVAGAHGETSLNRQQNNDISTDAIQQALFATSTTACVDPAGGCVPLNLFNAGTGIDPAALDFIRLNLQLQSITKQDYVTASISGDVDALKSPWASGTLAASFGVEYRQESSDYRPDFASQAGISPGFGQTLPTFGEYDVSEAFGEAILPLVEGAPFARSINLEVGYRHSDYSTSGGTDSYKYGADWEPVDGLRFRSMFQRAVRAANVSELYTPRTPGTGDLLVDPCANGTPGNPLTGAIRDICIAQGAPTPTIDNATITQPTAGQINNFSGGNTTLTPEEADTVTVGFVWQPDFAPGLALTVDYYDITVDNAISLRPAFDVVDACFSTARNPSLDPANADCQLMIRNNLNGTLEGDDEFGLVQLNGNIGEVHGEGIDYSVRYNFELPMGDLDLSFDGTHVLDSSYIPIIGGSRVECVARYGKQCGLPSTVTATTGGPTPENRFVQVTTWNVGPFSLGYAWRYLSGSDVDAAQAGITDPESSSIPNYNYIDLMGSWAVTDNVHLRAGITNVTDEEAPFVQTETGSTPFNSGNTYPSLYDVVGRVFTVSAQVKF